MSPLRRFCRVPDDDRNRVAVLRIKPHSDILCERWDFKYRIGVRAGIDNVLVAGLMKHQRAEVPRSPQFPARTKYKLPC